MILLQEACHSLAVGHMALAYLLSKPIAKAVRVNLNVPLLTVVSIIPDIDILFESFIFHRGPTHSVIVATVVFIPLFLLYRKTVIPYFASLLSHMLIGDFFIGGQIMLFWPFTRAEFGLHELGIAGAYFEFDNNVSIALEIALFTAAIILLFKSRDVCQFLQKRKMNLVLTIPIGTVLLPSIIGYPIQIPSLLLAPHLFFFVLFSVAVLVVFISFFRNHKANA